MYSLLVACTIAFTLLSPISAGSFRITCPNPIVIERVDPIISPGQVAKHIHTIFGGSNFGPSNNASFLRNSQCTSCSVKADNSNYWVPTLHFQWANGSFSLVDKSTELVVYYLRTNRTSDLYPLQAFPDGFRMVTGNPSLRHYNFTNLSSQNINFNCTGRLDKTNHNPFPDSNSTMTPFIPKYNCPTALRGIVVFPSCWDGINLDSPNHSSHVSYPLANGLCPASYPRRFPSLRFEMNWNTQFWNNLRPLALNPNQPFVLSSGDPTGYGYHGDFQTGWNKTILQKALETCNPSSGNVIDCPILANNNGLNLNTSVVCRKSPDVDEVVSGLLSKLPGCNPVSTLESESKCNSTTTPGFLISNVTMGSQ